MPAQFLNGAQPDPRVVRTLEQNLGPDELSLFAATTRGFSYGLKRLDTSTLLITSQRLIVSKEKLFGSPKIDAAVSLFDMTSCGCGPLGGTGPTWETHFRDKRGNPGLMYFLDEPQASTFKDKLKSACEGTLGPNRP